MAFNSAGVLFVSNAEGNNITEITPNGVQNIFASGLVEARALAFNTAGAPFVTEAPDETIIEITPDGTQNTFASGLSGPFGLAFEGETLPVPEPSVFGVLTVIGTAFLVCRHPRNRNIDGRGSARITVPHNVSVGVNRV